ncbi:hypothetical protein LCGC14_0886550 [marine sediment metagenome]|uniref:Uncharacterized protein n=1 Tax=marine sediment metagenome TaxID=412755 RepID=A0A0F9S7A1_9ZZZZ
MATKVEIAAETKVLDTMRSRFKMVMAAYTNSRNDELDDLRFFAGSPDNQWQWPSDVLGTRGTIQGQLVNARPSLTINKLPQHVRQVTNDQRQNRPSGKVIPADDAADIEVAEIFDGIVRHIEYSSDADVAYDTACENQVICGEGYIRILTEYADEESFDQDLKIGRIRNSFSVYMDPLIQDPCGMDAGWCFITEDVLKDDYERDWPDAQPVTTLMAEGTGDQSISQWISEKTVRIAEYFYIEYEKATLNLYPGNTVAFEGTQEAEDLTLYFGAPVNSRQVDRRKVLWCKTNGYEILEKRNWAGRYIPVIRVVGNEYEVEGELLVSGLVRNAKDAQRMYNYWTSQEAEMLALAPKAPFVGYGGQFEGYENQWKTANVQNWPYLEVNPDVTDGKGTVLPLPERSQPPMAQTGLIQAKMGASEDIKSTTGQYDASLGAQGNERSGKAILARQREGDTGSYHYVDNLARAVRYVTRQLIDLIPKIYDTVRIIQIIGEDGEASMVKLDPSQDEPVKNIVDDDENVIEKIYNPSVGKYDVRVTTGPGYATKRQEAREEMTELLQGNPELWKVAGDLFVKSMDWPGAQEIAKRLAKTIDPNLLSDDDDPALQAANRTIEEMGQVMDQMRQMLDNVEQSFENREIEVKEYDAMTKRLATIEESLSQGQIQDIVKGTLDAAIEAGDIGPSTPIEESTEV